MKCEYCGRGPSPENGGITVYRQNAFGQAGIWRCRACNEAPVDAEVAEIVAVIEGHAPPVHQEQEKG